MAARRILIVEDEAIIAMMIEDFLVELGWVVVGPAARRAQALAMVRDADIGAQRPNCATLLFGSAVSQLCQNQKNSASANCLPVYF